MNGITKKRLPEFDVAKAFALIAVLIEHSAFAGVPNRLSLFCFSFNMPLFFIVSGYFIHADQRCSFDYVKKQARGLLVPYALTCLIVIVLGTFKGVVLPGYSATWELKKWLLASLYGAGGVHVGMPEQIVGIGAIWYLWALFWGKVVIAALPTNQVVQWVVALVLFVCGRYTGTLFWLPFGLTNAMCAVLFLQIGRAVRQYGVLDKIHPAMLAVLFLVWMADWLFGGPIYMESNAYGAGFFDVIASTCATVFILCICRKLVQKAPSVMEPLARFGTITLPFFCMHLVELNLFPWDRVVNLCGGASPFAGFVVVCGQALVTSMLCVLLYHMPLVISAPFFPNKARA